MDDDFNDDNDDDDDEAFGGLNDSEVLLNIRSTDELLVNLVDLR